LNGAKKIKLKTFKSWTCLKFQYGRLSLETRIQDFKISIMYLHKLQ